LESLLRKGTREACGAMVDLMRKRPQDFWLGDLLAKMRTAARRAVWVTPPPRQLMRLFGNTEQRLIRTAGDLQALLIESLARYQAALGGNSPLEELWNTRREGGITTWDPKDENNLSNCLRRHIENDLERYGIIANREVQIRRGFDDNAAQVVDLLVQAVPFREDGTPGTPVCVIVEVKCAWNRGVFTDIEGQLFDRYLRHDFDFGIYLVAQFDCPIWNRANDSRKLQPGTRVSLAELQSKLNAEAQRLSSPEKKVSAIVVDAAIH
jgi:hypothetical protein